MENTEKVLAVLHPFLMLGTLAHAALAKHLCVDHNTLSRVSIFGEVH